MDEDKVVAVKLPKSLIRRAKFEAARHEITFRAAVIDALECALPPLEIIGSPNAAKRTAKK